MPSNMAMQNLMLDHESTTAYPDSWIVEGESNDQVTTDWIARSGCRQGYDVSTDGIDQVCICKDAVIENTFTTCDGKEIMTVQMDLPLTSSQEGHTG
jgi:hypothetical protein